MKLVYKHGQEKHFKIIKYPDGQQSIELDLSYFDNVKEPIEIVCSVRNFNELEILLCLVAALRKNDFYIESITFKYLFGMRSDRAFAIEQPNYFRDVLAPIINSLKIPTVKVFHPHSKLSFNYLDNNEIRFISLDDNYDYCIQIGGDKSARCCEYDFNYDDYESYFVKVRSYIGVIVELQERTIEKIKSSERPVLIYDDLCDGGATFIKEAQYLRDKSIITPERKLYLYIAHGLFTKGIDHVAQHYDKVITTNSYQEFEPHPKLEVIDVWT